MEILKCEGVRKLYGTGNNQVTALDRIDLSVEQGEFVAIVGASGSGKSTLLHILGSVDSPTEGKVLVEGTDISSMNRTQAAIFRRRKVGLVYQFYNLIPTLTVRKNILMPLLLDKRKPNPEYFRQILEQFKLDPSECLMVGNDVVEDLAIRTLGVPVFLVTDTMENKKNLPIDSEYQGSMEELLEFVKELPEV